MRAELLWLLLPLLAAALALLAARRPPQVTLVREVAQHAFAGQSGPLVVRLTLRSRLPLRFRLEDPPPRGVVAASLPSFGGLLLGEQTLEWRSEVGFGRRGVFEWPPVTLAWADVFGLWWRRTTLTVPTQVEVYPGTHGLQLPDLLRPLLSEGALSRTLGLDDPISLRGARPYVPGDPPGRVHWRLSARTGGLTVRELERTAASSLAVHLDLSGNEVYLESAVRLAASLIHDALAADLPVSLSTAGGATPPGRTPEALRLALRRLAQVQPQPGQRAHIPTPRSGSNLIVLAQHASEGLVGALMGARAGASRVLLVLLPEGFYLEPGERGRPLHGMPPDDIRALERMRSVLLDAGVLLLVLRGNQSVLRIAG